MRAFIEYCELQGLSKRTIDQHRSCLSIYCRKFSDPFSVTYEQALNFFSRGKAYGFASGTPSSPSNYNNIRNSLNKFYRWAVDTGQTRNNPIENVPRCKLPSTVPRRLTEEQTLRVLYHAQNFPHPSRYIRTRNYAMVATLLMTGLRARELLGLRNEDIRSDEPVIRVRHGKGNKERYVYYNDELPHILSDYLKERQRLRKESPWFFVSYRSNLALRYKNLREIITRISELSRVRFTAHQLRHTCFSTLVEQDVDIRSIQTQAGHASIISTQIYTHVTDRVRRQKIQRVSFLRSNPRL